MIDFNKLFFNQAIDVIEKLNLDEVNNLIEKLILFKSTNKGRIFFCGSGGGAGHSSHAAADFRKLLNLESYSITDNVSELTARINDEGWDTAYSNYLESSNFNSDDAIFVFSVGGGSIKPKISTQLVNAAKFAKNKNGMVLGILGRDGGEVKKISDASIIVPVVDDNFITPHTEGMQAYLWHFLVSHPDLNPNTPKWEGI
tara:strand:+ start:3638 stop:4237 length:600 start_codon:yes stop_codon:yes gene_type:complete